MNSRQLFKLILCLLFLTKFSIGKAQLTNSDIWIFDIVNNNDNFSFKNPNKITINKGYNNEPVFSPDNKNLLYVSSKNRAQTSIIKYSLVNQTSEQLTHSEKSEYSPIYLSDNSGFSVVRVENDTCMRLWKYSLKGDSATLLTPFIYNIGYYRWINKTEGVYVTSSEPAQLLRFDLNTQHSFYIDDSIGRCLEDIPYSTYISYMKISGIHNGIIKGYDTKTGIIKHNLKGNKNSSVELLSVNKNEDFVWFTPAGSDALIMGDNSKIFEIYTSNSKMKFFELQDLNEFKITTISRLVISPDHKKIAIVGKSLE